VGGTKEATVPKAPRGFQERERPSPDSVLKCPEKTISHKKTSNRLDPLKKNKKLKSGKKKKTGARFMAQQYNLHGHNRKNFFAGRSPNLPQNQTKQNNRQKQQELKKTHSGAPSKTAPRRPTVEREDFRRPITRILYTTKTEENNQKASTKNSGHKNTGGVLNARLQGAGGSPRNIAANFGLVLSTTIQP